MESNISKKLDMFFKQYKQRVYKKHEVLIPAASDPAGVFYITEGIVRQRTVTTNGEELTINTFKKYSFFPVAWVVNDTISPHFFEAMTPVTVWVAPKKEVLAFLHEEQDVLFDLVKRIYKGLDGYFLRMEYLMRGSAHARLIVELLIYAKRFGEQFEGISKVKLKITEEDIAAQSGIARETVSREMQKLRQKDLVYFEKNELIIKNTFLLEKELENS